MRYWSMCVAAGIKGFPTVVNELPGGVTDYGCRADEATAIDAGNYAYVLGSEGQRTRISKVPGATFLPFQTGTSAKIYLLLWRNMLVNPAFRYSTQSVGQVNDPSAAAAAMGPYYPKIRTCALATLTKGGVAACDQS